MRISLVAPQESICTKRILLLEQFYRLVSVFPISIIHTLTALLHDTGNYCCNCHGLLKKLHAPAKDRTGDPSIYSLALYHVTVKAGLYRKAVQVYYIPNLYPVTFSPSILNASSNYQEYKNHLK